MKREKEGRISQRVGNERKKERRVKRTQVGNERKGKRRKRKDERKKAQESKPYRGSVKSISPVPEAIDGLPIILPVEANHPVRINVFIQAEFQAPLI